MIIHIIGGGVYSLCAVSFNKECNNSRRPTSPILCRAEMIFKPHAYWSTSHRHMHALCPKIIIPQSDLCGCKAASLASHWLVGLSNLQWLPSLKENPPSHPHLLLQLSDWRHMFTCKKMDFLHSPQGASLSCITQEREQFKHSCSSDEQIQQLAKNRTMRQTVLQLMHLFSNLGFDWMQLSFKRYCGMQEDWHLKMNRLCESLHYFIFKLNEKKGTGSYSHY